MATPAPLLGILAGMGPRSTGPFLDLVVDACQSQYGARHDIDFPKMMVCSQPAPFYEDRPVDHAALEAATLEGLLDLQRAGVAFIAMACNTVHLYHASLAARLHVPLLNIVDEAVHALPPRSRVALVAARATATSGMYQQALVAAGHQVVDLPWQDEVDQLLGAVRETTDPLHFRARWARLLPQARAAGADRVLVACLDLSGVLRHAHEPALPLSDAATALAAALVTRWRNPHPA